MHGRQMPGTRITPGTLRVPLSLLNWSTANSWSAAHSRCRSENGIRPKPNPVLTSTPYQSELEPDYRMPEAGQVGAGGDCMTYIRCFRECGCCRMICLNWYIPLLLGTSSRSEGNWCAHSLSCGSAFVRGLTF